MSIGLIVLTKKLIFPFLLKIFDGNTLLQKSLLHGPRNRYQRHDKRVNKTIKSLTFLYWEFQRYSPTIILLQNPFGLGKKGTRKKKRRTLI